MRPSCCLAFLHHQSATPICQRARAIGRLHQTMQRIFVVPGKIRPLEADRHLRGVIHKKKNLLKKLLKNLLKNLLRFVILGK